LPRNPLICDLRRWLDFRDMHALLKGLSKEVGIKHLLRCCIIVSVVVIAALIRTSRR
jgi:hypothetical protein